MIKVKKSIEDIKVADDRWFARSGKTILDKGVLSFFLLLHEQPFLKKIMKYYKI